MMMENFSRIKDFEEHAARILPKHAAGFFNSGADNEQTLKDNCEAYKKWFFRPRILRNVSNVDLSSSILGLDLNFPVCIAPTSLSKMASHNGEIDAANAALRLGTLYTMSSISTTSIEEVANVGGKMWFQLYVFKDRNVTRHLVERAERNGFSAIVLTVDLSALGKRIPDIRNKFNLPNHLSLKNFEGYQGYKVEGKSESGMSEFTNSVYDSSLSWKDVDWLRSITNLPIILKGIITTQMAKEALSHEIKGIIVSNHGGRQLDGVPSTIDALPHIVEAVDGKCDIYLDGGVRTGADVAKALVLGAKAVFVGRPVIWGLACGGQYGVKRVFQILRDELEFTMRCLGVRSISELCNNPGLVVHLSSLPSKL